MSKISQYLNEHILGEVTSAESVRKQFSTDGSVLSITPELVVHPKVTNDIRKVARFTWQLAEKGHVMPMTVRGRGSDLTGAAIGKGVIINNLAHLNKIIYINQKNKDQFVHVQPGINFEALNETLKSHNMTVPVTTSSAAFSTVGGAVANNSIGEANSPICDYVDRLEVVLSNGDLIETNRINRRELNKKKGLQTFEGEIYRKIDGLIDDNQALIKEQLDDNSHNNLGYPGIAKVKQRDGSFDLTPLMVGSQGTLGIISEIVLKTDFCSNEESALVATFISPETARDAADTLAALKPSSIIMLDGKIFDMTTEHGRKYIFQSESSDSIGAVLYVSFNDYGERARLHKLKAASKKLLKIETTIYSSLNYSIDELKAVRDASAVLIQPEAKDESSPALIDGAYIPPSRREEFITAIDELAAKHHIELPLQINWLNNIINTRATMQLHRVSDKQKVFKLINDYAELVEKLDGNMIAKSGEGRLKVAAAYKHINKDLIELYAQIRATFDPFGTMNPDVKQESELKTLISHLNPEYSLGDFAKYSPRW